ncbi:MAG: hypothetical protein ACTS5A_01005 [Candidatus Hodgkinia cicadicola]
MLTNDLRVNVCLFYMYLRGRYSLIYESVVNVNRIWRVWLLPFDCLCLPFLLNHVSSFKSQPPSVPRGKLVG